MVGVYSIENPDFDFTAEPATYTSKTAQEHLRWAWRQSTELSKEVSAACVKEAQRLCLLFKHLPTLPPTESRWKVGRIACAMAAVAYSVDADGKLLVTTDHVTLASKYIQRLYSDERYKIGKAIGTGDIDSKKVGLAIQALGGVPFAKVLLSRGSIKFNSMKAALSVHGHVLGMDTMDKVMSTLTVFNECLSEHRNGFVKTDQFRRWLENYIRENESAA